jgi:hypothetical protein
MTVEEDPLQADPDALQSRSFELVSPPLEGGEVREEGAFFAVMSESSGEAEGFVGIPWEVRAGLPEGVDRRRFVVEHPPEPSPIDREAAFWADGAYKDEEGRAIATFTLLGFSEEMLEIVGPEPEGFSDEALLARDARIRAQIQWASEQVPRMEREVSSCGIEILQVLSSSMAAMAAVDFDQYRCLLSHAMTEVVDWAGNFEVSQSRADNLLTREAVRALTLNSIALRGQSRNRAAAAARIRIAVVGHSNHGFHESHPVFRLSSTDTRLIQRYTCNAAGCTVGVPISTNSADHGNQMACQAVGSLLNGQSPAFPASDPDGRQRRTGVAPDAVFYYCHVVGGGIAPALQHIRDLHVVDVVTVSLAPSCPTSLGWCHPANDCNSLNLFGTW